MWVITFQYNAHTLSLYLTTGGLSREVQAPLRAINNTRHKHRASKPNHCKHTRGSKAPV